MVHGTKTKRTSPHKARTSQAKGPSRPKSPAPAIFDKKSEPQVEEPAKGAQVLLMDDELLTPDSILRAHEARKAANATTTAGPQGAPTGVSILELLSKKDNLEKLATSVSQAIGAPAAPAKKSPPATPSNKSPPTTPSRRSNAPSSERFAGLSNSPAPSALPQPAFSFLDQELSKGTGEALPPPFLKAVSSPTILSGNSNHPANKPLAAPQPQAKPSPSSKKNRRPSPPARQQSFAEAPRSAARFTTESVSIPSAQPPAPRAMNHSPPSNPHLDELSSQLRMMLNIQPLQP